jgi:small conductance mechanosensitive channel
MLNTPDKKLVIIPNGPLYGRTYNYSTEARRVDWKFGIAYGDDVENFKRRLMILLLKTAEF